MQPVVAGSQSIVGRFLPSNVILLKYDQNYANDINTRFMSFAAY